MAFAKAFSMSAADEMSSLIVGESYWLIKESTNISKYEKMIDLAR